MASAAGDEVQKPVSLVASTRPLLGRDYREGEAQTFAMTATNTDHRRSLSYQAQASGVVKKDATGKFTEEFAWSKLVVDGTDVPLFPPTMQFRQILSLSPEHVITAPNPGAAPQLLGPILDLMAIYADLQLATRQHGLAMAGDRVFVKQGVPASWADGSFVVVGEDAMDLELTLAELDLQAGVATLVVRHTPPTQLSITIPSAWMRAPVADAPNNWIQVQKSNDGRFLGQVGKETIEVQIKVNLVDGRILSATMDNPVEVMERECSDAALTACGEPARYQIRRQIRIQS